MHPGFYAGITYAHTTPDRWFRIRVAHDGQYRIRIDDFHSPDLCEAAVGDFDTLLELYHSAGATLIASNDDTSGRSRCSDIYRTLAAGTYLVKVTVAGGVSSAHNGRRTILRFDPRY